MKRGGGYINNSFGICSQDGGQVRQTEKLTVQEITELCLPALPVGGTKTVCKKPFD